MPKKKQPQPIVSVKDLARATDTDIANIFGVVRRSVRAWNCPKAKDGTYDVAKVVNWKIARLVEVELGKQYAKLVEKKVVEKKWRGLLAWLHEGLCPACRKQVAAMAKKYRKGG